MRNWLCLVTFFFIQHALSVVSSVVIIIPKMANDINHYFKTIAGYLVIVYQFLVIDQRCLVLSTQNAASHLHCITFADLVTILCVVFTLCSCRWTHLIFQSRSSAWFIEWIVELLISVVLTRVFLTQFWTPAIAATTTWSMLLGKQLGHWNHCLASELISSVAEWLRIKSAIAVPIMGSVWMFYAMLRLTGQWVYCKTCVCVLGVFLAMTANSVVDLVWPFGKQSEVNAFCDVENDGRPRTRLRSRCLSRKNRC